MSHKETVLRLQESLIEVLSCCSSPELKGSELEEDIVLFVFIEFAVVWGVDSTVVVEGLGEEFVGVHVSPLLYKIYFDCFCFFRCFFVFHFSNTKLWYSVNGI